MLSFFNHKTSIGLDIHGTEVRLLQLKYHRAYRSIEKFAIVKLPQQAIFEGLIKEKALLAYALTKVVEETKTWGHAATMTIPSQNIIITRIKLSNLLNEKELEIEININLTRFFPGIPHSLCFDFVIMGIEKEYYDILLIATQSQLLNEYVELVEAAGLKVKIVDSSLLALIRVAQQMHSIDDFIGILELNANSAQFLITRNQKLLCNQHFVMANTKDFIAQLKLMIHQTLMLYPGHALHYCYYVAAGIIENFEQFIDPDFKVTLLSKKVFLNMRKSSQLDVEKLMECSHRLVVCLGLALREIKKC